MFLTNICDLTILITLGDLCLSRLPQYWVSLIQETVLSRMHPTEVGTGPSYLVPFQVDARQDRVGSNRIISRALHRHI